ncbi:MAG: hypothetical protein WD341_14835 [Tistlia sp.]|uniref:hypothetical protein n=1 Tax=Tistlia sp. TaxID=3057121 RepID=UPI0034A27C15
MRKNLFPVCAPVLAVLLSPIAALLAPDAARAAYVQYDSRAAFNAVGPTIAVDWDVFGPDGTLILTPDQRIVSGLTIGVASSQGLLQRADEGASYTGSFAPGDHLLTDAGSQSDTFIVRFGTPVSGFGAQIDAHYQIGPFTGFVELFSVTDMPLFTANFSGTSSNAQDDSAPFVGVVSEVADISYARFFVDQPGPLQPAGALAINRLDVLVAVPEPLGLALAASGLAGMAWLRRRRSV